jgi:hypothetical protein
VFSLSRLSRQGIFETFFSPLLLWCSFFPAFLRASELLGGSRYLVSVVFAVKDFVNFLLRPPASNFQRARTRPRGVRAARRWGPKREAVYAPGRGPSASTFVTIRHFPKKPAVSRVSDRRWLVFCAVIGWPEGNFCPVIGRPEGGFCPVFAWPEADPVRWSPWKRVPAGRLSGARSPAEDARDRR